MILIAEDVSPAVLHQLLRQGADEFVPYPLPENELQAAIERILQRARTGGHSRRPRQGQSRRPDSDGVVLAVHGLAGGTGATTLAVNLAWELATVEKKAENPKVCLMDFDLQFGSVARPISTCRAAMWSMRCGPIPNRWILTFSNRRSSPFNDTMWVLTAPLDMLPLDMITHEDVMRVIDLARKQVRLYHRRHALDPGRLDRNRPDARRRSISPRSSLTCARRRTPCA